MNIRGAMRTFLVLASGIPSLLGAPENIFVSRVPPGTQRRYVVLHSPGGDPAHMHLGGPAAFGTPLVQVECWADTMEGVEELADAVDAGLNGYRGAMGDLWVHACVRRDRRGPLLEDRQDGSADPIYSVQLDYVVSHRT